MRLFAGTLAEAGFLGGTALVEASFAAWLYGGASEASACDRAVALAADETLDAGLALYRECALGSPRVDDGSVPARVRAYAYLRAIERCACEETSTFARLAFDAADECGSAALRSACEIVVRRPRATQCAQRAPIEVSCAGRAVLVGGSEVRIPDREFSVVALLAVEPLGCSARALADRLWPDAERGGKNAVQAHISRLRRRLGDADAIISTRDGYRFDAMVRVDLREWQRLLRDAPQPPFTPATQRRLSTAFAALGHRRGPPCDAAFDPIERRLGEYQRKLATLLAADALLREDSQLLHRIGIAMIDWDACDEDASELVIRACLAMHDRAGALREFRRLRDALNRDFDVQPARSLHDLLLAD